MKLTANIVPNISGAIQRSPVGFAQSELLHGLTRNLKLADNIPVKTESTPFELLIGNDYYLDIVETEKIEVCPGLYLLSSKLGWILSGRSPMADTTGKSEDLNMLILTYGSDPTNDTMFTDIDTVLPSKPNLEDFWNVEAIGITDPQANTDDEEATQRFKETLKRDGGRYQVTWPWKEDRSELLENRGLAKGMLNALVNKVQRHPDLMQRYDTVIQDQLEKGVFETVDRNTYDGTKHYIPHHVVITPKKLTTTLRVVYDASAKVGKETKSLNECLYRGPVLLHDLCGMLMRFRLPKIGIVADIEKAFLQVELQPSERDVTRFLWFKNYEEPVVDERHIQEFRFCRVPFGMISSPFLLGATIETHLDLYQSPVACQLKDNIYMDNVVTGADNTHDTISLYKEAKSMFKDARMNLREWMTNSETVNSEIPSEDLTKEDTTKVLGYIWNPKADTLELQRSKTLESEMEPTKRNVLKQIASVYDPLGLLSPITIRGKVLLQQVWGKHLDWDDPLDQEDASEWQEIRDDLLKIQNIHIRRSVCLSDPEYEKGYTLVCFCDASNKAYATSVYLLQRSKN